GGFGGVLPARRPLPLRLLRRRLPLRLFRRPLAPCLALERPLLPDVVELLEYAGFGRQLHPGQLRSRKDMLVRLERLRRIECADPDELQIAAPTVVAP